MRRALRTLVGGVLMGSADLVPGVSGGTIALVLGIYERLVTSIKQGSSALGSLAKGDRAGFFAGLRRVEWGLLVPLLTGILVAVVSLASFLEHQLEERPTILAGAFLGLVIGSVVIAWRLIRRPAPWHLVIVLAVGAALFTLLGAGEGSVPSPSPLIFFGAGAIAICAMILPGISGSLILLIVGMYSPVLSAVTDRDLVTVLVFAAGALLGLALFSQVLNWALRKHHDPVMAGLVGLMVGSTRVLWPWPDGVSDPGLSTPADDWPVVLAAAVIGFLAVFAISRLAAERSATGGVADSAPGEHMVLEDRPDVRSGQRPLHGDQGAHEGGDRS